VCRREDSLIALYTLELFLFALVLLSFVIGAFKIFFKKIVLHHLFTHLMPMAEIKWFFVAAQRYIAGVVPLSIDPHLNQQSSGL
jgi:hypothetical protein